ncbi:CubicO group peptidase, beta-lactamase class C family [Solimonas aquatica]|uniref:CubicO group peptidase, beta-lactamase class C family n=1 Tax=Solimonas aquatica TaxID=489703 RepID=A0A1H9J7T2_9GAMM|nr:serine hydrolase domain-containing protein [Solimonas aquatica]SEQ83101.1 CubicO group peptidase, beta-lactamase class C family [Solimonas aquatica]
MRLLDLQRRLPAVLPHPLRALLGTRVHVPDDLSAVTQIDHAAECEPQRVAMSDEGVARIWSAVENFYRTGLQPAITLVMRRQGRVLMKRSIGCVRGNLPGEEQDFEPLTPDTPISLFSASKSISALLVHKAAELGLLQLHDHIADHIPEFAAAGKAAVTVRDLLAHRAGIPAVPQVEPAPELLRQWDKIIALLCAERPFDRHFERQAYHALSAGFITGELLRRVTKRELPELMREWLAEPLQLRYLTYGLKPELRHLAPPNVQTGVKPYWPATRYIERVVGVSFDAAIHASNDDAFLSAVVPAGNIYASADDVSRVFQMLLDGGELDGRRVLKAQTVREALRPVGAMQLDRTLLLPMRYSAGFMLGENPFGLFGLKSRRAFGHLGFVNVLAWADPSRDISVALLNTGKSLEPAAYVRLIGVVHAIGKACSRLD